jgi:hypothetical protein
MHCCADLPAVVAGRFRAASLHDHLLESRHEIFTLSSASYYRHVQRHVTISVM